MQILNVIVSLVAHASCPNALNPFGHFYNHDQLVREIGMNHALHFEELTGRDDARFLHVNLGHDDHLLIGRTSSTVFVAAVERDHMIENAVSLKAFKSGRIDQILERFRLETLEHLAFYRSDTLDDAGTIIDALQAMSSR